MTSKSSQYPPPSVYEPQQTHLHTLIILHGRGSTATKFAEPFLSHRVTPFLKDDPEVKLFRNYFPNAKFIFPTASLQRSTIYGRSLTHQWFDHWSLDQPEYRQELQIGSLKESISYIQELLRQEIDIIGAKNVFLVGLSQGCATALLTAITWNGPKFAGVLGMCGWLPFRKSIEEAIQEPDELPDDDPFGEAEDVSSREALASKDTLSDLMKARQWLREELDLAPEDETKDVERVPIFLGHGLLDEKVPSQLGKAAVQLLEALEYNVQWAEYAGLAHWYSEDMLRDMILFIRSHYIE
jgi:predicted esterase